jgi:hypothetical protein
LKFYKSIFLVVLIIIACGIFTGCSSTGAALESEDSYKNEAVFVSDVKTFTQNPDQYKGKKVQIALNVYDIKENGKDVNIYASPGGLDLNGQIFLFHYKMKDGDKKFEKGDLLRFFCEYKGLSESKEIAVMGEPKKVIECDAAFIEKPLWGDLYDLSTTPKKHMIANVDGRKVIFAFSKPVLTADSIDITEGAVGIPPEQSVVVDAMGTMKFKGSIKDDGEGEFQYIDKSGNPTGAKFTLKFSDQKTATLETDKISVSVKQNNPFSPFINNADVPATLNAGTYDMKTDF